jgi:cellulose biosynthesis protein BcsQ
MVREEELLKKHSLGSTFAAKTVTPELIAANVCTVKGIKNLYLYGLLKGEHTLAYPMIGERQANELMAELKKQYDVVIADCTANLTENLLSIAALKHADSVVRLYGCDFKTLSFYSSIGWEIEKCGLDSARFYKVISDVRDIERMRKMYQKPEFYLMHREELCRQYFAGDVFRNLERKESRLYYTQLSVLADELIT